MTTVTTPVPELITNNIQEPADDNPSQQNTMEEEVERMLSLAKVDPSELKTESQVIYFDDPLHSDDLMLVQLDSHLLSQVEEGKYITFRGKEDDFPVICTAERTYSVKEAETSASLLILPQLKFKAQLTDIPEGSSQRQAHKTTISAVKYRFLEVKPVPKISTTRLREVLEEYPFLGVDIANTDDKRCSLDTLLNVVQASESELIAGLKQLPVTLIDGSYFWLDFDYLSNTVSHILDRCDTGSIDWRNFTLKELDSVAEQKFPVAVRETFLRLFAVPKEGTSGEYYELDARRICRFMAETLLKQVKRFVFNDFWRAWEESVPDGMEVKEEYLQGLGLIDRGGRTSTIEYFSVSDLPEDPQTRFDLLFRQRPKWKEEDIVHYLKDLAAGNVTVGSLLTKYCRSSVVNGVKWFNTRERAFSAN